MPTGIYTRTKEHNKKIALAHKGIKLTKEHRNSLSRSHLGIPNKNKGKGKQYHIGKSGSHKGYKFIRVDGKDYGEHILVYLKSNNLNRIPKGLCIHHLNGNKLDNRPENLVMLDRKTHTSLHKSFYHTIKGGIYEQIC